MRRYRFSVIEGSKRTYMKEIEVKRKPFIIGAAIAGAVIAAGVVVISKLKDNGEAEVYAQNQVSR